MVRSPAELPSTEAITSASGRLDGQASLAVLEPLLAGQRRAIEAVDQALASLGTAVDASVLRLSSGSGRLILAGAGASGRIAVQDGAELWPTFGWPAERLLLCMAGGEAALLHSIEGTEDDVAAAIASVNAFEVGDADVVVAVAASGTSPWTLAWAKAARQSGVLTVGLANNPGAPLLATVECPVLLDSGAEVLAGSTRLGAGTAQKVSLNLFSTTLMARMNLVYGNLMVDMAATNVKLDQRRIRMLQSIRPVLDDASATDALAQAQGWVKLAVLISLGDSPDEGRCRLAAHAGSLRDAMSALEPSANT